jgi:hypothetical protein
MTIYDIKIGSPLKIIATGSISAEITDLTNTYFKFDSKRASFGTGLNRMWFNRKLLYIIPIDGGCCIKKDILAVELSKLYDSMNKS